MGELLMTVLLVSILWMILDLLKVFFQEHREGPGNEAVRDPGRQKLTQYAEAFEGLSETFLKLPKLKEDLEKEDREEILKETSHQVCRTTGFFPWKRGGGASTAFLLHPLGPVSGRAAA